MQTFLPYPDFSGKITSLDYENRKIERINNYYSVFYDNLYREKPN